MTDYKGPLTSSSIEISSRVKSYALKTNGNNETTAEIIQVVFLHLLDQYSGWEDKYAHTTKVFLQESPSQDDSHQQRIRRLIRETIAHTDRSRKPEETPIDVLAEVFNGVETVRCEYWAYET